MGSKELYSDPIKKESKWFWFFTILSILMPLFGLFSSWMPADETLSSWFQRSGSAMVVCSLLAESRAISIYNILNPSGFVHLGFALTERENKKRPVIFNKISFLLIAIGTIIWGYGDLLF